MRSGRQRLKEERFKKFEQLFKDGLIFFPLERAKQTKKDRESKSNKIEREIRLQKCLTNFEFWCETYFPQFNLKQK